MEVVWAIPLPQHLAQPRSEVQPQALCAGMLIRSGSPLPGPNRAFLQLVPGCLGKPCSSTMRMENGGFTDYLMVTRPPLPWT